MEFISNVSRVAYEVVFNVVPAGLGVVAVGAGELLVGDADEVGFDVGVALSPVHAVPRIAATIATIRVGPRMRLRALIVPL